MSTTAVILAGQCRTFPRCLPSLAWQVFSKLENPHFFASVAKDEDAGAIELLRARYPNAPVHIEVVEQPTLAEPPWEHTLHAPYAITPTRTPGVGPLQGILRQLWHNSRAYRFACEAAKKESSTHIPGLLDYDLVVRSRMDLMFARFVRPLHLGLAIKDTDAFTPYWGHFGPGVNDRFAILGKTAAKAYFETYDNLPAMLADGIPFHPETLVGAAIERAGCTISRTLLAEFAMLRKPTPQNPQGEFVHMQVLPGELAEWVTHLSRQ